MAKPFLGRRGKGEITGTAPLVFHSCPGLWKIRSVPFFFCCSWLSPCNHCSEQVKSLRLVVTLAVHIHN